ncbi:MAG: protein kinase [Elusimicrobiota bacterium]
MTRRLVLLSVAAFLLSAALPFPARSWVQCDQLEYDIGRTAPDCARKEKAKNQAQTEWQKYQRLCERNSQQDSDSNYCAIASRNKAAYLQANALYEKCIKVLNGYKNTHAQNGCESKEGCSGECCNPSTSEMRRLCQFKTGHSTRDRTVEEQVAPGLQAIPTFSSGDGTLCHDGRKLRSSNKCERPPGQAEEAWERPPDEDPGSGGGGDYAAIKNEEKGWERLNEDRGKFRGGRSASNAGGGSSGVGRGRLKEFAADDYINKMRPDFGTFEQGEGGKMLGPSAADRERSDKFVGYARQLIMGGDPKQAIKYLLQAIQSNPFNAEAHYKLAQAYNMTKNYAGAERAAQEAVRLDPNNAKAYEELAWAQLHQGKFKDALSAAKRAAELAPNSAWAHALAAMAYEGMGDHSRMIAALERAAALDTVFLGHLQLARAQMRIFNPNRDNEFLRGAIPMAQRKGSLWKFLALVALLTGMLALVWWKFSHMLKPFNDALARKLTGKASPAVTKQEEFMAEGGLKVGKFELTRIIGKGSMGVVWEGKDPALDRAVAVKKMAAELGENGSQARAQLVQSFKAAAALQHPDIVEIYEIIDDKTGLYVVFELVQGRTLRRIIDEHKTMPLPAATMILLPVCRALSFVHGKGLSHRALKPSNIMLNAQGQAKVTDCGIAHPAQSPSLYTAPEAAQGLVTPLADVYALGLCCYEMLTGERPYGDAPAHASTHLGYVPASQRVAGLPPQLDVLIDRALKPRKEERLQSVQEFYALLAAVPGAVTPAA